MDWNMRPERAPGIEIREVTDGFVVYDPGRDRLHFLNLTATLLLESCDGNVRTVGVTPASRPGQTTAPRATDRIAPLTAAADGFASPSA